MRIDPANDQLVQHFPIPFFKSETNFTVLFVFQSLILQYIPIWSRVIPYATHDKISAILLNVITCNSTISAGQIWSFSAGDC